MKCDRCDQENDCAPTVMHGILRVQTGVQMRPVGAGDLPGIKGPVLINGKGNSAGPMMTQEPVYSLIPVSVSYVGCRDCRIERVNQELKGLEDPQGMAAWFNRPKKADAK